MVSSVFPDPDVPDEASGSKVDLLTQRLQTAIIKGEIAAGSKIKEPELAKTYGVSRGPLREALARLEERHLVQRIPNVGASVVSLSSQQLLDIYDVREALEGMACRLAAQQMPAVELEQLASLLDRHEEQVRSDEGRSYYQDEGDWDFHFRIAKGSGNHTLIQFLCGELYQLMRLYRYQFSFSSGRPLKALQEHRQIISALQDGDGEFAEILMRRHIRAARKNLHEKILQLSAQAGH